MAVERDQENRRKKVHLEKLEPGLWSRTYELKSLQSSLTLSSDGLAPMQKEKVLERTGTESDIFHEPAHIPSTASSAIRGNRKKRSRVILPDSRPSTRMVSNLPANHKDIKAPMKRNRVATELEGTPGMKSHADTTQESHNRKRVRLQDDKMNPRAIENAKACKAALRVTGGGTQSSNSLVNGQGTASSSVSGLKNNHCVPDCRPKPSNSTTLSFTSSSSSSSTLNPSCQSVVPQGNVSEPAVTNTHSLPGTKKRPTKKKLKAVVQYGEYFNMYWIENCLLPCIYYDVAGGENGNCLNVLFICRTRFHYDVQVEKYCSSSALLLSS
jgi:hypothetical protein